MAFKKVIVDYLGRLAEMLATDTIHPDQLGTGTRDGTKVLRDDGTWVTAGEGATYTGDKTITGNINSKISFQTELNEKGYGVDGAYIIVDPVNGTDGLDNDSYYANFSGTPTNKFQSWAAACKWVNQVGRPTVYIEVVNTTAIAPLINSTAVTLTGKSQVSIVSATGGNQYIRLTNTFTVYNTIVSSARIEWQLYGDDYLRVSDKSVLYLNNTTFTPQAGVLSLIALLNGTVNFDSGVNTVNFSANNQVLFHVTGNDGGKVIFSNHAGLGESFVVGAFTGLRWGSNTPSRSLETYFVTTPSTPISSAINMIDTVCYFGTSLGLRITTYDSKYFNYSLGLGGTTPLIFENLNSSSPNMVFTTKKKLIVDEDGEVGVYDDTGGSGGIAIDVKSVDLRGVLDTGTNGVGTNIFGYTVVLGDKVLLKDINADWGVFTVEASSMTLTSQDSIVHVSDGSYSGYIYSYDNFNGQYRLVGDNATITGIITLDFGNEDNKAFNQINITGTGLQNESEIKNISIIPQETTETSIDDFVLNNVSFFISNLNNSFDTIDIIGIANNGASGVYTVRYTITY